MKKSLRSSIFSTLALSAVLATASSWSSVVPAGAQSFNGGGMRNPNSPTGWSQNPGYLEGSAANPGLGLNSPYAYGRPGFYNPYYTNVPVAPVYPFGNPYINPIAAGNGFYSFNGGGYNANMWRANSGYYYPWYAGGFNQIIYVDQSGGQNQTVAKTPPISMQFDDMTQFLDDAKKKGKVSEVDYQSLTRRLKDIHSKERSLRIAGGGELAEGDQADIQQNLKDFGREMTERVKL